MRSGGGSGSLRLKKEAAPDYLESAYDSPFMILHRAGATGKTQPDSFRNPLAWQRASANRRARSSLWFDEFGAVTGVPVIMNTAFNLRGEAMVNTPSNALRTFFSSGMDALVIGRFLVEK